MYTHTFQDYQRKKPFSSFLSGIAGKMGIPLWSFYVNRGQLISSFGMRDKNGMMMEFFPANQAYHFVSKIGFRTFIKIDGKIHEFFKEANPNQTIFIRADQVKIEEINPDLNIKINVTYFTLPNEGVAALVRKVDIETLDGKKKSFELIDGLAQILPSGIDYGGYKAISNLLQSWMASEHDDQFVFYKLRASTGDSAEVSEVKDGNFYQTVASKKPYYISDYKLIFHEDTSLTTPYGFIETSFESLVNIPQTHVNQVPCAMSGFDFKDTSKETFISLIGYASDYDFLKSFSNKISVTYLKLKEKENQTIHESLMQAVDTKTNEPMLDAYFKQCYLDNVLRGGVPTLFETKDGTVGYHLFSRKHGDLERDYNFFSIEPAFYSQGNGNFRDVLQNRRNDLLFDPNIKDFNIYQFASLIQADGYNPLSIEGVKFTFDGDLNQVPKVLHSVLKKEFTPGEIATTLYQASLEVEETLKKVLKDSHVQVKASFGEGYWEDHFTYHYDTIESFLSIYPDELKKLMFQPKYPFFKSPVKVLKRSEKYVLTKDGKVRQFGAIKHDHHGKSGWLKNSHGTVIVNLFGKLLTLVLNKYGHLDPYGIGLSYEGDKPGWNDAMNGVPGLFGSGVSETIELKKIVDLLIKVAQMHQKETVYVLASTDRLANYYLNVPASDDLRAFNYRMDGLETYRDELDQEQHVETNQAGHYLKILSSIEHDLTKALDKAKALGKVMPTYLTYEATAYDVIKNEKNEPVIGHYGLPLVKVHQFKMRPLPIFLEAPARYLKAHASKEEAKYLYTEVKKTGLYDQPLKFYQTSVSLDDEGHDIGRIRAFTQGWLERESNFLHMTYKYLLGILKAGLYDEFFEEVKTNFTCFMDPNVYGRSPVENSSFLATSTNPDPKKHGQGFVSRLTGSTAEVLSMWRYMFFGEKLFTYEQDELTFSLSPKLPASWFKDGQVSVKLFKQTEVIYHNEDHINTYDPEARIYKMTLEKKGEIVEVNDHKIIGKWTRDIREGYVYKINVYIRGGK